MHNRLVRVCAALLLALTLLVSAAGAETVRGDLSQRFGDVEKIEYNGKYYSLRSRISTVLAMAVVTDEQGLQRADFARLLLVDDENKTFSMLDIPGNTLVQIESFDGNETWNMLFADAYALDSDLNADCERLVAAVNGLLGQDLVEDYIAFDMRGMPVLTGGEPVEGSTREQLHVLKAILEEMTTDELNDTYALLGDYIVTNMKSGAVMKIVDKSDRYERLDTRSLPGGEMPTSNNGPVFVADADALEALKFDFFFKENAW